MADKKASIIVKLVDLFSTPLSGVISGLGKLKAGYLAVSAALAGVIAFLKSSLDEYGEQQKAVAKLENALKNQGIASAGASKRLQEQAGALQKLAGVADNVILEMDGLLATFGFNEEAIKQLMPRILDLSAATEVDLHTATVALAKSIQTGSVAALKKYGFGIDEAIFKNRDFAGILAALDEKVKDQAETVGNTYPGKVAKLRLAWDDFKKAIASFLVGPAGELLDFLTNSLYWVNQQVIRIPVLAREYSRWFLVVAKAVKGATAGMVDFVPAIEAIIKNQSDLAKKTNQVSDAFSKEIKIGGEVSEKMRGFSDSLKRKLEADAESWGHMFAGTVLNIRNEFSSGIAHMIVRGGDFRETMENIGLNIAEQFISQVINRMVSAWLAGLVAQSVAADTFRATETAKNTAFAAQNAAIISSAFAGVGLMALDQIIAKKQGASGFERLFGGMFPFLTGGATGLNFIGNIGKKLFSGGVINEPTLMFGMKSGQMGMAGENGVPEALISFPEMGMTPMGGRDAFLGRGGGSGGTTVVINAGTLIADEMSVRRFATRIDEELFKLNRNRHSVALG